MKKLLAMLLAAVMVVSLLPAAVLADGDSSVPLTGTIFNSKTATWDYYQGNGLKADYAFDGDESTFWLSGGTDLGTLGNEYVGINYGAVVDINSVKIITNVGRPDVNGATYLQVSEDGSTWVNAYELTQTAEEGQLPVTDLSYDDFTEEAKAVSVKQLRVHRYADAKDADGNTVWHNLRVYEIAVEGSYVIPEDTAYDVTYFAEPLSTTFGTKADLLAEPYVMKNDGLAGITMILKVDGIPVGTTATVEGIEPVVKSGEKAPGSAWASTWVYNGRNGYEFASDGYYAYYFDFRSLNDAGDITASVAGETTLHNFILFQTGGAFNWWGDKEKNDSTVNEGITVSLVGIAEGSISAGAVFAYDENGEFLGKGDTTTVIDANSGNYVWGKLKSGFDIYSGSGNGEADQSIVSWADRDGNAVDFILGQAKIVGTYGVAPVKIEAVISDGAAAGAPMEMNISVCDNYQTFDKATICIFYDNTLFTAVETTGDLEILSDADGVLTVSIEPESTVESVTADLGCIYFDISEEAFACEYEFTVVATEMTNAAGDVANNGTSVSVIPAGRRQGFYDLGTFAYDEEVIVVDEEFIPYEQSRNLTIIVEVNGLNGGTLKLGGIRVGANGIDSNNSGNYTKGTTFDMADDGYYAIQIDLAVMTWVGSTYERINRIAINDSGNTRGGVSEFIPAEGDTESAPTVTYHAVYVGAPEANAEYIGADGSVLATSGYELPGQWCKAVKLDDYASLYTGELPVKESDIAEVTYEFVGWESETGDEVTADSPVTAVEKVYASFVENDMRTTYTVKFVNYDGSVLQEDTVPEGIVPEYSGETPKKPSTDTKSYAFDGWDKEIVATPVTPEADGGDGGEIIYTAKYLETDRTYNVYFYNEDGTTKLGETLGIIKGEEAKTDIAPEKASDVQYDYTFDGWVTLDGKEFDITNITEDVSVKASFTATLRKYTVTYLDEDKETVLGTEEVEYGSAATGKGIEAVKEADEWYTYDFGKWVSDDENVDITVVTGDVSVYALYNATFVPHYADIEPTRFYSKAVEWALTNGIMNGTSDTTFSPGGTTTRGQVVTVLHRMEGTPAPDSENIKNFDDVPAGKYYSDAVMWAASYGVVKGVSATTFEPDTPVTREQFATILYRYAGEVKGYYVGFGKASLSGFEDKNDISGWAASAVKWAIATEDDMYTQGSVGYGKGYFITGVVAEDNKTYMYPKASATRGQMVTMLERFVNSEHLTQAEADEQL